MIFHHAALPRPYRVGNPDPGQMYGILSDEEMARPFFDTTPCPVCGQPAGVHPTKEGCKWDSLGGVNRRCCV